DVVAPPAPIVLTSLDGFALTLLVSEEPGAPAKLRVNGVVNRLAGPPAKATSTDGRSLAIERIDARRALLDATQELPADGTPAKLRFGEGPIVVETTVAGD